MKIQLKLSQLSKDSMTSRQQSQLMGGSFCYWSEENQAANDAQGKCSCACGGCDYYDAGGLHYEAQYLLQYP